MEQKLYKTILNVLKEVKEIRFIDFDLGQLSVEKPPISYPAVLVDIDYPITKNIGIKTQEVSCIIKLTIVAKSTAETNNLTTEIIRSKGLEFLNLRQKVYQKLQGLESNEFFPLERKSTRSQNIRIGLKTTVIQFETSFHDYSAN